MLECFSTSEPPNLTQHPYALWNRLIQLHTVRVGDQHIYPSYTQLRAIIKAKKLDAGLNDYCTALSNGLMGGHLDWDLQDIRSNRPLHTSVSQAQTELWIHSVHVAPWLEAWARANDVTVVQRRPFWLPLQLYHSLDRLNVLVDRGPVRMFFINPVVRSKSRYTGKAHHNRLIKMLAVRRAREELNRERGKLIWKPEGLTLLPQAALGDLRSDIVRLTRKHAKFIKSRLLYGQVVVNGLPGSNRPVGYLHAVDPGRLHGVLKTLVLGKYDALDNQVSLTGFTYERPEKSVSV